MENTFLYLSILMVFKYWLAILLILKGLKELSYSEEFVMSCFILCLFHSLTGQIYITMLLFTIEYITMKIIVLITIILLKHISFKLLVSATHNGIAFKIFSRIFNKKKLCLKLSQLHKIKYGPRLKQGLPAMAKKVHKKTKIRFDRKGFPIFKSYFTLKLCITDYKKSREVHFSKANKMLYKKALKSKKIRKLFNKADMDNLKSNVTPEKYTWHHHQKRGKLQLVSRKVHAEVNHIGGYSIWGA